MLRVVPPLTINANTGYYNGMTCVPCFHFCFLSVFRFLPLGLRFLHSSIYSALFPFPSVFNILLLSLHPFSIFFRTFSCYHARSVCLPFFCYVLTILRPIFSVQCSLFYPSYLHIHPPNRGASFNTRSDVTVILSPFATSALCV